MFDDARPERQQLKIWVAAFDRTRLTCARCNSEILHRDVAFYTRTRPGDSFDPWCPSCAHIMVRWAGVGALETGSMDNQEAAEYLVELLNDGS
jgi:hypothetical protein